MIDLQPSGAIVVLTMVAVVLGFFVLLASLLIPQESIVAESMSTMSTTPPLTQTITVVDRVFSASVPGEDLATTPASHELNVKSSETLAEHETITVETLEYDEAATTPTVAPVVAFAEMPLGSTGNVLEPSQPVEPYAPNVPSLFASQTQSLMLEEKTMSWTTLVDESAVELDLQTRLRLIEALGIIGGNWSREVLARAYEQELDAAVRGAIFVALRDSRSAA